MRLFYLIYKYLLMIFLSCSILLFVSVLWIGWNLSIGNIIVKEILIPNSEIKIVGKAYSPSIRVAGGAEVIHANCRVGVGNLCWKYYGETFYANNVRLLGINNHSYIIIYGNFKPNSDSFTVNNYSNIKELVKREADEVRVYPKFFFAITLALLPLVIIGFLVKKRIGNNAEFN